MILAMAQMAMSQSLNENFEKAMDMVDHAAGANLIFFPESQLSPFVPRFYAGGSSPKTDYMHEDYLLDEENWCINRFIAKAQEQHICISPNLYMRRKGKACNTSLMITYEGVVMRENIEIDIAGKPDFCGRKSHTTPTVDYSVYNLPFGRVGIINFHAQPCFESVHLCMQQEVQLILIPTANLKSEPTDKFEREICAFAFHNNVFIAMCNRVGRAYDTDFAGKSLVVSPSGEIIQKSDGKERLILSDFTI